MGGKQAHRAVTAHRKEVYPMLTPVPCPNCGSDDLSIDCYDTMRYSYTYVQCNSCLRLVKTMDSREDTIQRWNDLAARYRKRRPKTPQ